MQGLTENQQFWKAHLEELEAFDGSAAEYARVHGLEAKKLYSYKTRLRDLEFTQGRHLKPMPYL